MKAKGAVLNLFVILTILQVFSRISGLSKFVMLKCEMLNDDMAQFKECKIRELNKKTNVIDLNLKLKHNVKECAIDVQMMKKTDVWRPFLFKAHINACEFMKNQQKFIVANIIYDYVKSYTSMNHTCPYKKDEELIIRSLQMQEAKVLQRFPVTVGEYGLFSKWYVEKKLIATVNGSVYFF